MNTTKKTLFTLDYKPFKITKPIRLIELFAGIGAQAKAFERLDEKGLLPYGFEHYRICEFDKYAVESYNAIHHTNFETSDITKLHSSDLGIVDKDKYDYLMFYSYPCTDLSLAGKQAGMSKEDWLNGKSTRSGLLWEVERLLDECYAENGINGLPQILIMENVPQVHSEKNIDDFNLWIDKLKSLGYASYWKDLNSKNFGVPQNRNRTFMVSILGKYTFKFPKEFPLEKRLKDVLEDNVSEKYYLSDTLVKGFINHSNLQKQLGNGFEFSPYNEDELDNVDYAKTITTCAGNRMDDNFIQSDNPPPLELAK